MPDNNKTVLGIDTSGKIASIAVMNESGLFAEHTFMTKLTHSQVLLPLLKDILKEINITLNDIDAIAVAEGPGSYTGLRIGISAVKGLCFPHDKKCMGISTLKSLAMNVEESVKTIFSCIKARDDVAYFGVYKSNGKGVLELEKDTVISLNEIKKKREEYKDIILVGDYSKAIKNELFKDDENVILAGIKNQNQTASSLCQIALLEWDKLVSAEEIDAKYLQITKAEKDRKEKLKWLELDAITQVLT